MTKITVDAKIANFLRAKSFPRQILIVDPETKLWVAGIVKTA